MSPLITYLGGRKMTAFFVGAVGVVWLAYLKAAPEAFTALGLIVVGFAGGNAYVSGKHAGKVNGD